MKILLIAGLFMIVLGIASLVVPIPQSETHGIRTGDVNIGTQTSHSEKVSPVISVVTDRRRDCVECSRRTPGVIEELKLLPEFPIRLGLLGHSASSRRRYTPSVRWRP